MNIVFLTCGYRNWLNFDFSDSAYYVEQCSRDDPEVNTCLMHSANRLARLLQRGIPELGMEEVMYYNFKYSFFDFKKKFLLKTNVKTFFQVEISDFEAWKNYYLSLKHWKMSHKLQKNTKYVLRFHVQILVFDIDIQTYLNFMGFLYFCLKEFFSTDDKNSNKACKNKTFFAKKIFCIKWGFNFDECSNQCFILLY